MALHDVRNFVGDHTCKLCLVARCLDCSQVDEDRATRKGESVDLFLIDHVKTVGPLLAGRMRGEFHAKTLNITGDRI